MKVKVGLDWFCYFKKPEKKEFPKISREVVKNIEEVDIGYLADLVGNQGYAFCPGIFREEKKGNVFRMPVVCT